MPCEPEHPTQQARSSETNPFRELGDEEASPSDLFAEAEDHRRREVYDGDEPEGREYHEPVRPLGQVENETCSLEKRWLGYAADARDPHEGVSWKCVEDWEHPSGSEPFHRPGAPADRLQRTPREDARDNRRKRG